MSNKGVPKSEEHKRKIGLGNKGIHLNKTNSGILVLKDGKKLCPKCGEWKLLSAYDKRPERPIGVKPKCKACTKAYQLDHLEIKKLASYRSAAKKRGLIFGITKEEFLTFWQKPCHYCGSDIQTVGIDRIDSTRGYFMDNIVSCCAICNTMKLALPRDVFIEHCLKVITHQNIIPD